VQEALVAEAANQEFSTVLGPDASFEGKLTFEKGMRLHGKFNGSINSPGRLHVAKEAKMEADVEAGSIIIEGDVKGNLSASDRVEMKPTTRYEGDLTASKLVVEEGAQFKGHVTVGPDAVKSRPPQAGGPRIGTAAPQRPQEQPKQ
jgi:cytoskeletal protein CcmA (bactofilin family)